MRRKWLMQFDRSFVRLACLAGWLAAFGPPMCPAVAEVSQALQVELNSDLFASVQDKTLGVREVEKHAYYQVLQHARQVDYARQQAVARAFQDVRRSKTPALRDDPQRPFPAFRDLFQNYSEYRGMPVTLEGHVRQIIPFPRHSDIPMDVDTLYEAWIYTDDSDANPAVVVLTSVPEGIPMGHDLVEQVSVTGYFFKMYGYRAQDTTRLAPLLLAQRLEWLPQDESIVWRPSWFAYVVLLAVLAAAAWLVVRSEQRDRGVHTVRRTKNWEPPTEPLSDSEASESASSEFDRP